MNNKSKKVFKCTEPECEYESTRKYNLERHMLYHAAEQVHLYECKACDEAIKDNFNLTKHKASRKHCENVRNFFPDCVKVKTCTFSGAESILKTKPKYVNQYIVEKRSVAASKTGKIGFLKVDPNTQVCAYWCLACDEALKDEAEVKFHRTLKNHIHKVRDNFPECLKEHCYLLETKPHFINIYIIAKRSSKRSYVKIDREKPDQDDENDYDNDFEEETNEDEDFSGQIESCKQKIDQMIQEIQVSDPNKLKGPISKGISDMKRWTDTDESTYFKYNDLESQLEELL
jgi:hypothetical protein